MLLLSAISIIAVNCEKEGPPGSQGPAGPAGSAGPAGPAGPIGTANVIYSNWFTPVQNGGWVDTTINGVAAQKKFNKSAPAVTAAILNTGLILAFVKLNPDGAGGTTTSIRQLPYPNPGAANQIIILSYVGSITYAWVSTANPGVAVPAASTALEFRYMIVPGSVVAGRMANGNIERLVNINDMDYSASQLNAMSYEEICALLKIPE